MTVRADVILRAWVGHEAFVRKRVGSPDLGPDGWTHVLEADIGTRIVSVQFTELPHRPGLMAIRSVNWRVEHEPSGVMRLKDARELWRQLARAGMSWTSSILPNRRTG